MPTTSRRPLICAAASPLPPVKPISDRPQYWPQVSNFTGSLSQARSLPASVVIGLVAPLVTSVPPVKMVERLSVTGQPL